MKAPKKVITAMAMAALLGGTAVPAFAASGTVGFETTTGVIGQDPLQISEQHKANKDDLQQAEGDIIINGEFTKYVNSFPEATEDGHYLRVTMPLTLNYQYNVNTNEMTSAEGIIRNQSVSVTDSASSKKEKGQPINMSFVGLDEPSEDVEYVEHIDPKNNKLQLPFKLVITKNGEEVRQIPLENLISVPEAQKSIKIEDNNSLKLKIEKIDGQSISDTSGILKDGKRTISNSLTLKFEYAGK